jgi:hypothetical protein
LDANASARARTARGGRDQTNAPLRHAARKKATLLAQRGNRFRGQRVEFLLEQHPHQDGQDDQIEEGSRRCREALRGEGRPGPDSSECVISRRNRAVASVLRSRAKRLTLLASSGNRCASAMASCKSPTLSLCPEATSVRPLLN